MACPICQVENAPKRRHTPEELAKHHPLAGHGKGGEAGFCCEEARLAHDADVARLVAEARGREAAIAKTSN